ncbi:IclR family transcriptional regulator domain-containing protein [Aestuariivirga sp. YIM B02566]|uniref:Helix-turn-helix domain-containing protein n=1 Tax=Taklimakanibacter albus TaxID=2800327 RepID=A0ACC5R0A5_9HYPH|nr:helix-turn-helix domain-containing protein [Aestuariivirga sp. YIM B02566]MBK1866040.1 helix-turn-helix domain-containing protein [Aestuariivirga sp. YIM B02566]
MPSFEPVNAVVRALDILRLINEIGPVSVVDLQKRSAMPKATVLRMVETLIAQGYVSRSENALYAPTGKCLLLSSGFDSKASYVKAAEPVLAKLRDRIGWPSDFAIYDNDAMLIVLASSELGVLSITGQGAARTPLLRSALGRIYLAHLSDEERKSLLDRFLPADPLAGTRRQVEKILGDAGERGYAISDEAYLDTLYPAGMHALAVPVLGGKRPLAAVNVLFLRKALTLEKGIKTLLPALRAAAKEIGEGIGQESR